MKKAILMFLVIWLFLVVFLQAQTTTLGNIPVDVYEGTTTAATVIDQDFPNKSYKIIVYNLDSTNELYIKFFPTTTQVSITAGMIDTAAHRQTNDIITLEKNTSLTIDGYYDSFSLFTASAETAVYRIYVLERGPL